VVRLGEGRLPEELESGLLGLTVGETRTIETNLPDDHRDEQLRGKKAIYIVTLDELQEQILPEVTDEFVKTLGMGAQTALELRLKIREQMEKQREQQEQTEIHAQILKELLESNPFSVPQSMIDGEIRGLLVRNGYVDPSKIDVHRMPVDTFREQLGKLAEERARTSIIVERIVEQESIEFSDEDVKKLMEEISEEHGMPVADVEKALLSDGRKANFVREQKQKKALDLLRERASIKRTKKEEK
jgi:trigger factor